MSETPAMLVQRQLDTYNAQDLDAYCACFDPEIIVADLNGAITIRGIEAYRARYADVFAKWPENKAHLLNRIVVGDKVIDHERVERAPGAERFDVAAIYTLKGGRIVRVDFVK